MLQAGADKVSLNSAAVARPEVIREASEWFGAQAIVLSMDVKWNGEFYEIVTHGGRRPTGMEAVEWAQRGVELGAGEIVVNSIDADGTKNGFEIRLTRMISDAVTVPVVASGGAGNADHMADVLLEGRADAALAASIFHYGTLRISDVKARLIERGLPMRPIQPPDDEEAGVSERSQRPSAPAFDRLELVPAIVQDATQRPGADARLHERARRTGAPSPTARSGSGAAAATGSGARARPPATSCELRSLRIDCDGDTVLVQADPVGPTCHTNAVSCFFTSAHESDGPPPSPEVAAELFATIKQRLAERPEGSYIAKLAERGIERMAQKVGEEATEVVIAGVTAQPRGPDHRDGRPLVPHASSCSPRAA